MKRSTVIRFLLTLGGALLATATVLLSEASAISRILVVVGAALPVIGLVQSDLRTALRRNRGRDESSSGDPEQDFNAWREQAIEDLRQESERIDARWKQLNERTLQYRELLEYPADPDLIARQQTPDLSALDREVNEILEQEAARVYEIIRVNGYSVNGRLDTNAIRAEVFDIVQRVARAYQPNSTNPLLETSFEQLARSASRVCLQALVLVEQLPLDVQSYNINQLYGYVRKAVSAWGHWQTVSPWVTQLGRGLYAGRIAASSNPVTLGTWWLASELGRHGAKRLVENVVDKHAIAFLNDVVRLIGTEVACVFGPGIRQRDPAWIYGTEVTELLHRFPPSRDSLAEALRQVTALPLRSEYDRIYLYRCLAEHRPAGFRLSDPAALTREERDEIARRLEHFFSHFIHGTKEKDVAKWSESVHERLDLRMRLNEAGYEIAPVDSSAAVVSVHRFLTGVAGLSADRAWEIIASGDLFRSLPSDTREQLTQQPADVEPIPFEPPDLDPSDARTTAWLETLADCCARGGVFDRQTETLLEETGRYFRRSAEEMRAIIGTAWNASLVSRMRPDAPGHTGWQRFARTIVEQLQPDEMVTALYRNVSCEPTLTLPDSTSTELCLVSLEGLHGRRVLLLDRQSEQSVLWTATTDLRAERLKGLVVDDCAVSGGKWNITVSPSTVIRVGGRFARGGYDRWFRPLLS